MPIRAVTLDAYGTLFDLDAVMRPACERLLGEQGIDARAESLMREWTGDFFALLERYSVRAAPGFRTVREITAEALESSFERLGVSGDVTRGVNAWFETVLAAPLYPEVREAVAALAGRYRLAVVSDADDAVLMPAWRSAGLPVDIVLTSERARGYKIDPGGAIFRCAFEALGVEPGETAHVGDSRSDVVGATRAGATAVWLCRDGRRWDDGRAEPAFVARDLAEVVRLLE